MSPTTPERLPVYLVVGEDAALLSHATSALLDRLCGSERALVFSEVSADADLSGVLGAVNLFAPFQVVLVRNPVEPQLSQLVGYLSSPEPSTHLVIASSKDLSCSSPGDAGGKPRKLSALVRAAGGEVVEASPRKPADAVRMLLEDAPVVLDGQARQLLTVHVGEDVSGVPAVLSVLVTLYGPGARISAEMLEPHLGEAGGVPPWDLTDALDRHDVLASLRALRRMLSARAPLAVFATVSNHFDRMFRLSEAGIVSERDAAEFLGLKGSTFPAKKALSSSRRYRDLPGSLELVAAAATDLRGGSGLRPELVLEILVARLAARP